MFEVINDSNRKVDEEEILYNYVKYLVEKLELSNCEFNIILTTNEKIHEINLKYRNVDRETDVISFALEDEKDIEYTDFRLLGDIYISIDMLFSDTWNSSFTRLRPYE